MQRSNTIVVVLLVVAFLAYRAAQRQGNTGRKEPVATNEIEYLGEKYKLTRHYTDYDSYKDDENNIDPSENSRIEQAMIHAKIGRSFSGPMNVILAVGRLQFPGYGSTHFGEKPQADGSVLAGHSVEIPRADKDRVLVFRGRKGFYTLIDDFIAPSEPKIVIVEERTGELVYRSFDGKEVMARPLNETKARSPGS